MGQSMRGRTSLTLPIEAKVTTGGLSDTVFRRLFWKTCPSVFVVLRLVSRKHTYGFPKISRPKVVCTCESWVYVLCLVVWRTVSQSGRRLRLQTLARREFLLSTCGQKCCKQTVRMEVLTSIFLNCQSSICWSHLPELYCDALLAHFLVGDTEMSGFFLCSDGCTIQSWSRCRNCSLVCMQHIGGSKPQNPFLNESLCHNCSCYYSVRESDYLFRYDQKIQLWPWCICFPYLGYA